MGWANNFAVHGLDIAHGRFEISLAGPRRVGPSASLRVALCAIGRRVHKDVRVWVVREQLHTYTRVRSA